MGSLERLPRRSQIRSHNNWVVHEPTRRAHYSIFSCAPGIPIALEISHVRPARISTRASL
jgi:hypothetical protein